MVIETRSAPYIIYSAPGGGSFRIQGVYRFLGGKHTTGCNLAATQWKKNKKSPKSSKTEEDHCMCLFGNFLRGL